MPGSSVHSDGEDIAFLSIGAAAPYANAARVRTRPGNSTAMNRRWTMATYTEPRQ